MLVPWAGSAEDHQTLNVRWLADEEGACDARAPAREVDRLVAIVGDLRADAARRAALSARASELGAVHRSGALAQLVESVALA